MTIFEMPEQHPRDGEDDVILFVSRADGFLKRRVTTIDPHRIFQKPAQLGALCRVFKADHQPRSDALALLFARRLAVRIARFEHGFDCDG